jgi:hypothetical protein
MKRHATFSIDIIFPSGSFREPKPDKPDHFGAIDCIHDGKAPPRMTNSTASARPLFTPR